MSADFLDHHPGLVDVTELSTYKRNLAAVMNATEMKARIDDVVAAGDKVFTRITLTGRHVGDFLGVPATGNSLEWVTHELWRAEDGRMVERWAVDDLVTLLHQMGVTLPQWSDPQA
jgi:predicted ester cyclase